jgi:hypothetical protein
MTFAAGHGFGRLVQSVLVAWSYIRQQLLNPDKKDLGLEARVSVT